MLSEAKGLHKARANFRFESGIDFGSIFSHVLILL